jgi:small subunit ribosomal protein S35
MRVAAPRSLPAGSSRQFSSSTVVAARRSLVRGARSVKPTLEDLTPEDDMPEDTTWAGHQLLAQNRRALYYMRLVEHEVPRLVGVLHLCCSVSRGN